MSKYTVEFFKFIIQLSAGGVTGYFVHMKYPESFNAPIFSAMAAMVLALYLTRPKI
jgi:hypothetical protein